MTLPDDLKEPAAVCTDLGIAAVISFHRHDIAAARRYLAAAVPYAKRIGYRLVGPLLLARSLDLELDSALPEALTALTDAFSIPKKPRRSRTCSRDAVRLAIEAGDLAKAHAFASQAVSLAAGSEIPHRQAAALYCRGLLDHDASGLLAAAERYGAPDGRCCAPGRWRRPRWSSIAAVTQDQARAAYTDAAEIYTWLGAAVDAARVQAR